jgi:hypothetical protein
MKKNYIMSSFLMLLLLACFAIANTANAQLYINEFMASNDSALAGPQGDFPDWIEIYNAGTTDVMLGGYFLFDSYDLTEAIAIPATYPDSVTVAAGGFILFYANKGEASSVLNLNFKLSGSGEQIGFWAPDQSLIDSVTFSGQTGNVSFGRYMDGTDNWYAMADYTPGSANTDPNLTPVPVALYINEFMASNDAAFPGPQGDHPDWIEIYNAGAEAVMLGGYYMADILSDSAALFQIPATYPDSVTVPAGGFIVFYANKMDASSVMSLNFKLSGGGEQIGLWAPDMAVIDTLTYTAQIADTSYGRYMDGTDNWYMMADFTPGAPNTNPNPGPGDVELYINEFMASNDFAFPGPQGDHPDWIEIYNAGTEPVMLGGYYMADILSDPSALYQIPATYPDSVTVPAGGFIVFYANKMDASSVMSLNFKLSGDGEQIGLWAPDMSVIDTLTYTAQIADTSYGRYPDGSETWMMMPNFTPGAPNQPAAINELHGNISQLGNSPNPFSTETNIQFALKKTDHVIIRLYDARGSLIEVLANGVFQSGSHSLNWSAAEMKAGYYFYTLQTSNSTLSRKAVIVK